MKFQIFYLWQSKSDTSLTGQGGCL